MSIQEEVQELREQLRNERKGQSEATSTASGDFESISFGGDREERAISQDISGIIREAGTNDDTSTSVDRSFNEKPKRIRSSVRRYGKDNSSIVSHTEENGTTSRRNRKLGSFQADDNIPERKESNREEANEANENQSVWESRKTPTRASSKTTDKEKKNIRLSVGKKDSTTGKETGNTGEEKETFKLPNVFKEGSTLSVAEAKILEQPLIDALQADLFYVDMYLWHKCQDHTQTAIWSNITDDEIAVLAKLMLKQGQRNKVAASTVRNVVNGSDYLSALAIVVPRTIQTVNAIKAAPKREKVSFLQRKRRVAQNENQY